MRNNFYNDHLLVQTTKSTKNNFLPKPLKLKEYGIVYNFTFISLIAPYLLNNLRLSNITSSPSTPKKSTILLKQSYLIYTWFYFLKTSTIANTKNAKNNSIVFSILPIKRKSYTLTKAPMAHKTNSKEQYVFKFYKFKACITTNFINNYSLNSVDSGLLALLLTNSVFPVFGTNLLLLKYYSITISLCDSQFFNYYSFLQHYQNLK